MKEILKTFNFESLLIKDYQNWYLLLRDNQTTLGSLVLIEKHFHTKLSDISNKSFEEFGEIVREIEFVIKELFGYEKINYLMLMMKDNEVHYHIIPRYSSNRIYESFIFNDFGWPALPDFKNSNDIEMNLKLKIKDLIKNKINKL